MSERHHPASARKRMERGQRRAVRQEIAPDNRQHQRRTFQEPRGFARGARVGVRP